MQTQKIKDRRIQQWIELPPAPPRIFPFQICPHHPVVTCCTSRRWCRRRCAPPPPSRGARRCSRVARVRAPPPPGEPSRAPSRAPPGPGAAAPPETGTRRRDAGERHAAVQRPPRRVRQAQAGARSALDTGKGRSRCAVRRVAARRPSSGRRTPKHAGIAHRVNPFPRTDRTATKCFTGDA